MSDDDRQFIQGIEAGMTVGDEVWGNDLRRLLAMIQERDAEIARLRVERNNASTFTAKAYQHEIQYLKADADRLRKQLAVARAAVELFANRGAGPLAHRLAAQAVLVELDAIDAEAKNVSG